MILQFFGMDFLRLQRYHSAAEKNERSSPMKHKPTPHEQGPDSYQLRAKHLLPSGTTLLVFTSLSERQLRAILEIVSGHGEPPEIKQ